MEGVFAVKISPLGANLCLLEEMEEGYLAYLIGDDNVWWKLWFSKIHPWKASNVDDTRVTWLRFYVIPCHAWCPKFFVSLVDSLGTFVCVHENTARGDILDIARIIVRVPAPFSMKDSLLVSIDGVEFTILMREDSYGLFRLWKESDVATKADSSSSSKESWGKSDEAMGEMENDGISEGSLSI